MPTPEIYTYSQARSLHDHIPILPQGAHSWPGQCRPTPLSQWRAVAGSTSSSPPLVLISTDVGRHLSQQMSQQQEGTGVLDLALPLARQVLPMPLKRLEMVKVAL